MFVGTGIIADAAVRAKVGTPPKIWGRFCYSIGGDMDKLNLVKFYQIGKELSVMRGLETDMENMNVLLTLIHPHSWVSSFLSETQAVPMPNTRLAAQNLLAAINVILDPLLKSIALRDGKLSMPDKSRLDIALDSFEEEFEHDSREINIFSVSNQCAYSTTILIDRGEHVLPESVRAVVTDYDRNELHEAGRCLAFNLPTAAGFHMVRAVESVLRGYYDVVTTGAPRPKRKNGKDESMGAYIDQLIHAKVDINITSVLWDVKRLHRDPLTHPEDVLDSEQATVLLGVVTSAITAMVRDIKKRGANSLPFVKIVS